MISKTGIAKTGTAKTGTMALPRPRAVLFDWDSTLVDNWGAITLALAETFVAMGREPWGEDEVRANAKRSMRESFPLLFGDRAEEAGKLFYDAFSRNHLETVEALPGAEDLLHRLHGAGIPIALVSNKNGTYLRAEARRLGWDGMFHRMIGATDAPRDKPAPDAVLMALEETGLAPHDDIWFVGDSAIDMACAHAVGCVPIMLHPEDPHPEDISDTPPAIHLPGCLELVQILAI